MATTLSVVRLNVIDLGRRLSQGEVLTILDVREVPERAYCAIRIPPASTDLHIPLGEIASRISEIRDAVGARPLVVYCHHGVRSLMAAEWLARAGLTGVHNLEGGIDAWSREVDPDVPRYC